MAHIALRQSLPEFLRYIELNPESVNEVESSSGNTVLHSILLKYLTPRVRPLLDAVLKHNLTINTKNHFGQSPLHLAAKIQVPTIIHRLLEADADITAVDHDGRSLLYNAIISGSL